VAAARHPGDFGTSLSICSALAACLAAARSFAEPPHTQGLLDGNLNVTLSHLHILQLQDFTEVEGKRDRLFCELLFAARDLAARNITRETRTRICRECGMVAEPSEHLPHSGSPIRRHSVA